MVRIVTVIDNPHLATYMPKGYEHKCCTICQYKIIIEDDEVDSGLLVASVLDEEGIEYFNAKEYYDKREQEDYSTDGDFFYPFRRRVTKADVEEFTQCMIENGWGAEDSRSMVLADISASGINCDDEVRAMIKELLTPEP